MVIISLIAITAILYFMQHYALNHSFVLNTASPYAVKAISDDALHNGKTTSTVKVVDNKYILDCEIIESDYKWPFCELAFQLFDEENPELHYGIDLSQFDTVTVHASYRNISPFGIRLQIRNYHNDYSKLNDDSTWKYTGIEYFLLDDKPLTIPLDALQVATWWLLEQKIPISHAAPDLNNVMALELATGNNIKPGKYQIILDKLVFQGKRYRTEQVYGVIILLWSSVTLFLLFYHLIKSRQSLSSAHQKAQELIRLNKLLNVQTQELKDQAERDPLTGALNRVGIKGLFTKEIPLLSIAFIDIDHFKQINDIHGHVVGDDILKHFSALLSENSRDTDFLARWGGEEFLLVCPNTSLEQANTLAEGIRQLIENYQWPSNIKLTASFGLAQRKKESPTDFIARADKALYAAKAQGRNKVVQAK